MSNKEHNDLIKKKGTILPEGLNDFFRIARSTPNPDQNESYIEDCVSEQVRPWSIARLVHNIPHQTPPWSEVGLHEKPHWPNLYPDGVGDWAR